MKQRRSLARSMGPWVLVAFGVSGAACTSNGESPGPKAAGGMSSAGGAVSVAVGGAGGGSTGQGGQGQGGFNQGGAAIGGATQGGANAGGEALGCGGQGGSGGSSLFCGDGQSCGSESCDDGNNVSCDGCRDDCSGTNPIGLQLVYAGPKPGDPNVGKLELWIDNCETLAGVQFNINVTLVEVSGGTTQDWSTAFGGPPNNTVISFGVLFGGAPIGPGDGLLMNIFFDKSSVVKPGICITAVTMANWPSATSIPTDVGPCISALVVI